MLLNSTHIFQGFGILNRTILVPIVLEMINRSTCYVETHIDFPEPSEAPFSLMKKAHTGDCLYQPVRDTTVMTRLYIWEQL